MIFLFGLLMSGNSCPIAMDLFQIVHNAEMVSLDIHLAFTT